MFDLGDPKFKLFGKTIPLPSDADEPSGDSIRSVTKLITQQRDAEDEAHKLQECERKSSDDSVLEDDSCPRIADEKSSEDQNEPISVNGTSDDEAQKDEESTQGEESKNSQDKGLKRPDKILPCPRCNSMDTKFCYYNNYNVHQPRHFCKSCQRYWTAGGTMRNVPVGAGRRKNKSSSSKYCHISISDALNGVHPHQQHQTGLKMNGTLLTFGSDSPHLESMASMMNLAEKKVKSGENGDDRSSGSSTVTTSGSVEGSSLKHQPSQNVNGFPGHHRVPFFPGFQLAYGWNPAVSMPPPPPGTAFPPMPFYPAPYWHGAAIPWNGPWVTPCQLTPKIPVLNSSSPTLGKHSRSEDAVNPSVDPEKRASSSRVLLPKTLRIDNPEEAAKSSIWNTLGIKKVESVGNGGFFNGLQSKGEEKKRKMETCPLLNANPAALARSISCQETA